MAGNRQRPRVAHLTSAHTWQDIRIYRRMCRTLADAGYDVHLVVPCSDPPPASATGGVTIHPVPRPHSESRWERVTKTTRHVRDEAVRVDAQVYHLHDPELLPVGLWLRRRGKLVIYDAHEDLPATLLDRPWILPALGRVAAPPVSWLLRRWAGRMSAVIGAEEEITKSLARPGQLSASIRNYPQLSEFPAPSDWSVRRESNLLVSFGGLQRERCADMIVRAVGQLEPRYDYRLMISGHLSDEPFLESLRALPAFPRLEYPGLVGMDQMKQYLYQARLEFVLFSSSPNHLRVRSNRFFEALAAGVPVITADFPHWREVVGETGCGIPVPPDDPTAIAAAIRQLWDDPAGAEAMGRRGREAAEQRFCWEQERTRLLDLYGRLVGGGAA